MTTNKEKSKIWWKNKAKEHGYRSKCFMLKRLYKQYNGITSVGEALGITGMAVHKQLKKCRINTKSRGGKNSSIYKWETIAKSKGYKNTKLMLTAMSHSYSFDQIARLLGCSKTTIHKLFKKNNIKIIIGNKKIKRPAKEVKEGYKKIHQQIKEEKGEEVKMCSCCNVRPVYPGFTFLCLKCYKRNSE